MSKKLVLCVDDNEESADFMDFWLTQQGYEVRLATSYSKALEILESQEFDLSIIDIRLADPQADGFDLCKFILATSPDTKVIFNSGDTRPEMKNRAKEVGARALFGKPTNFGEMDIVIHELIGI